MALLKRSSATICWKSLPEADFFPGQKCNHVNRRLVALPIFAKRLIMQRVECPVPGTTNTII